MPDLTEHTTYICSTNVAWSTTVKGSHGDEYTVRFGLMPLPHPVQHDWSCDCKGFKFRGTCRHITEVRASGARCGWNAELELGVTPTQTESADICCPDCGQPVQGVRVAV